MKQKFLSKIFLSLIILFNCLIPAYSQLLTNQVTSVSWENNALIVNTTQKITYAESRLKDPERLVVDILNCTLTTKSLEKTFKSGDTLEAADAQDVELQYLYNDGEMWHFMSPTTYEQYTVSKATIDDSAKWLKEQDVCMVKTFVKKR